MNKKQANRQILVESFQRAFEKKYGYVPSVRRTKKGLFLFDEGNKNEVLIEKGFIAHEICVMNNF